MAEPNEAGFLLRWSRRKAQVQGVETIVPDAQALPVAPVDKGPPVVDTAAVIDAPSAPPPPTMADVALLDRGSDYARFIAAGVDEGVKRAAMKKLFADPHFNLMDGLDTYIDDYGKPDPIPLAMLRQMNQSKFLRLFDDEDEEEKKRAELPAPAAPTEETPSPHDDDADLRLQQDHAVGQPEPDQGPGA